MANSINFKVRSDVGAFARLEGIIVVERLPKTRSGKILRRIIKNIINEEEYKPPATIDDESILETIHALSVNTGFNEACIRPDQRYKE